LRGFAVASCNCQTEGFELEMLLYDKPGRLFRSPGYIFEGLPCTKFLSPPGFLRLIAAETPVRHCAWGRCRSSSGKQGHCQEPCRSLRSREIPYQPARVYPGFEQQVTCGHKRSLIKAGIKGSTDKRNKKDEAITSSF
jgi:hypothetical protein